QPARQVRVRNDPRAPDQDRGACDRAHRAHPCPAADELPGKGAVPRRRAPPHAIRPMNRGAVCPDEPPTTADQPGRVGRRVASHRSARTERRRARRQTFLQKRSAWCMIAAKGFWKKYNAYLESKEWQDKRERVLKRANGQCEGCGAKAATQAHHLTYAHVFNEFLFELVAVCDDCHQRLHADDAPDDGRIRPCDDCRHESEEEGKAWCSLSDVSAKEALSADGDCGPNRSLFEPLR